MGANRQAEIDRQINRGTHTDRQPNNRKTNS